MLLVPILALSLAAVPQDNEGRTYAACLATPDPVVCVTDLAVAGDRSLELNDLIAAGAVTAARRQAPARGRRIVGLAARIALAERPVMSAADAQLVLALLSEVEFYDSGLPEDGRAAWLWPIALNAPIEDLEVRERLIFAAGRAERSEDLRSLIAEAPLDGDWSDDQRASFASVVARMGLDWRAAEAWLASGGERAGGYDIEGIRREIARARLLESYDAASAARLADAIVADEELSLWMDDDVEALTAAGAAAEMRRVATALVQRGQDPGQSLDDRTHDFGVASQLFEGTGDRSAALDAAREGAALTPAAVTARLAYYEDREEWTAAQQAQKATDAITLPVAQLYRLGAEDEALANGYLVGRDRYMVELRAGRRPNPEWITPPQIDFELKLLVPSLAARKAAGEAGELLARLRRDPNAWAEADAEELMMLAAIAGEAQQVEAIFDDAVRNLDESEDMATWAALRLVIGRRAAEAELRRDRTGRQSP